MNISPMSSKYANVYIAFRSQLNDSKDMDFLKIQKHILYICTKLLQHQIIRYTEFPIGTSQQNGYILTWPMM